MTRFSVCLPYHDNPLMLKAQYIMLAGAPADVELIVCDDASPAPPPWPHVSQLNVRLFRIEPPHIPWSHRCATNIAAHHASGDVFLITDIDHMVPRETWKYLNVMAPLRDGEVCTFGRRNMDGSEYKPHPDSWLMTRHTWDTIGGYDTRYRGHYGQNMPFIERVRALATDIRQLSVPLVRVSRDEIPDASTRDLTRKSDAARQAIHALRTKFRAEKTFLRPGDIVPHIELKR